MYFSKANKKSKIVFFERAFSFFLYNNDEGSHRAETIRIEG